MLMTFRPLFIGSFTILMAAGIISAAVFCEFLIVPIGDRNYTAMHTHVQWSVHLSALLIT